MAMSNLRLSLAVPPPPADLSILQQDLHPTGRGLELPLRSYTADAISNNSTNTPSCVDVEENSSLHIELKTDDYPGETSWALIDTNTNEVLHGEERYRYKGRSVYSEEFCIPQNSCYQVILNDFVGDGIRSPGYFKVSYDDVVMLDLSGGIDNYWYRRESIRFGGECYPTASPTFEPSKNETPVETFTISGVLGGIFFLFMVILCARLHDSSEGTIHNHNEQQTNGNDANNSNNGNNNTSTLEKRKKNRRLKVLTNIIHKKVLSKRKMKNDNLSGSDGEVLLPHEKELSNRSMTTSLRRSSLKNNDEALGLTAVAYAVATIFPIAVPLTNEDRDENQEQKEEYTLVKKNKIDHLKDDIYLTSFRSSKKSLYSPKSCPICLEEYKANDEIAWSKNHDCAHAFHLDCILDWLMDNEDCPLCRAHYLSENAEESC